MRECPTYLPRHGGSVHVYTRLLYSADTRHNGTCLTVDKSKIYHSRGFSNGIFTLYPGHLDKFCMNDSHLKPKSGNR